MRIWERFHYLLRDLQIVNALRRFKMTSSQNDICQIPEDFFGASCICLYQIRNLTNLILQRQLYFKYKLKFSKIRFMLVNILYVRR